MSEKLAQLKKKGGSGLIYGTWHYSANPIAVNVGDVLDVIWENASIPTFRGCTQETIFSISSSKKVVRLTATSNSISYSGDDYMMCYVTYEKNN